MPALIAWRYTCKGCGAVTEGNAKWGPGRAHPWPAGWLITSESATCPACLAAKPMLGRQDEALAFILDYRREHGYGPSVREVGAALGQASTQSTQRVLCALRAKGRVAGAGRLMQIREGVVE